MTEAGAAKIAPMPTASDALTVNDGFLAPIAGLFEASQHAYPCHEISDPAWVRMGIQRVLEEVPSGRGFLQEHGPRFDLSLKASNYFTSLKGDDCDAGVVDDLSWNAKRDCEKGQPDQTSTVQRTHLDGIVAPELRSNGVVVGVKTMAHFWTVGRVFDLPQDAPSILATTGMMLGSGNLGSSLTSAVAQRGVLESSAWKRLFAVCLGVTDYVASQSRNFRIFPVRFPPLFAFSV